MAQMRHFMILKYNLNFLKIGLFLEIVLNSILYIHCSQHNYRLLCTKKRTLILVMNKPNPPIKYLYENLPFRNSLLRGLSGFM